MLSDTQKIIKRTFDFTLAVSILLFIWWFILLLAIISSIDTKKSGIFIQERIGYKGLPFKIYKIRTMKSSNEIELSNITTKNDKRITKIGRKIRHYKLDELPQIINVIIGNMSFVGPRPDFKGYADNLKGDDRILLTVKPGITGPASIYFKNEEDLLENQSNPVNYNDNVIWPKKVELNKDYIKNYSFINDITYIYKTII
ncbi:sugar transferase [Lacinutrix sp. MedPE-SW]|uniref:sugar transferase n=1 Tax=Lacinutrix sp. MedPE-SW TaxID=1860087 RepID=UPI0009175B91|nr:sugar transferase [Lacinutrix sp. MedPE-SW]OIQ23512.1 MAG: sugar transferase [Lacinutrix sp. MedPE-SW]